jgi:hypothetical protein
MKPACEIHDWMFAVYKCNEGFCLANDLFKNNMIRINHQHQGMGILKKARVPLILVYHFFVENAGKPFYFEAQIA